MGLRSRRAATVFAFAALTGSTAAAPVVHAADPIQVLWTAPALQATTPAAPQLVDATDHGIFVAGALDGALDGQSSLGNADGFVARYDGEGNLIWARHVGTSGTDYLTSLVVTTAGVFVGGRTSTRVEDGVVHDREGFVAFLTLDGDRGWHFPEVDPHDIPVRLAPTADGGVIAGMTGYVDLPAPDTRRPLFYRHLRPDGTIVWEDEFLGWWTDDVDVDASGITVSGQRPGTNIGEAIVRRYSLAGEHVWTKVVASAFTSDVRVWEIASTDEGIWASGEGLVPIDESPGVWPDDKRFVRRLGYDGATVWTHAINAYRIIADCGTYVGVGDSVPDDADQRRGAYLARFDANGTELWRWTEAGDHDTTVGFNDVDVRGGRAYIIREEFTGGDPSIRRLVALANVPKAPACATPDTTVPTATAPGRRLVTGTAISSGRTTVRLSWTASDTTSGIARYELRQSTDGGAFASVSTALTSASLDRLLATGHSYRFQVRAIDQAGNAGLWMTGSTFRLTHYSETNSRIRYTGTWATTRSTAFWGGQAKRSSSAGARATISVTGRSVEWIARKGPDRGRAQVYVNGVLKATVDLYASTYQNQRVVWAGNWAASATRTVSIRVLGTTGRPRVELDAIVSGT